MGTMNELLTDQPDPIDRVSHESATAPSSMLRLYLQDMGVTPLLHPEMEVSLATELCASRLAIAELAQALPETCTPGCPPRHPKSGP